MFGTLENKVIIVTGGAGLIGKHIVEKCKNLKGIVIDVDLNYKSDLSQGIYGCDLTKTSEVDKLILDVINFHGRIDGLVNNAYPRTKDWGQNFENILYESWQSNVDMQLNSVFYLCQKVLDVMKTQKSGSIVNITSIYGVVGNDFTIYQDYGGTSPAAYSAIKGGLINFSRYLASYYGKEGIRVNCVSPGGIIDIKNQNPSFIKRYSEKSPLKRLGNPEEISPAVCFLLSEEASFITGHNLMVDGGWTAI